MSDFQSTKFSIQQRFEGHDPDRVALQWVRDDVTRCRRTEAKSRRAVVSTGLVATAMAMMTGATAMAGVMVAIGPAVGTALWSILTIKAIGFWREDRAERIAAEKGLGICEDLQSDLEARIAAGKDGTDG